MNRFEVRGSMQRRRRPLLTGRLAMSSAFRVAPAFVMGVATDWTAAIAEGEASCVRVISPMAEAGTARALAWEFALFGAIEEGKEGNHGNEMANHSKELLVMAMVSDVKKSTEFSAAVSTWKAWPAESVALVGSRKACSFRLASNVPPSLRLVFSFGGCVGRAAGCTRRPQYYRGQCPQERIVVLSCVGHHHVFG